MTENKTQQSTNGAAALAASRRKGMALATMVCGLTLMAALAHGQQPNEGEDGDDEGGKVWRELEVAPPAPPVAAELIPFDAGATATQTFLVDPKSISVGSDGVVRYTLVSRSAAGATNVSFEGIRCSSFEKKILAIGRPDGSWAKSRRDQWDKISLNGINRQHASLARDFFCDGSLIAGTPERMVQRLRAQR
ncbi:CNP1-like family protein [Noviherbaspirillum humi]|uniref:CNP1-like family protein n=1 Tax=Noviherbaspirillum humi TaxID=1688639 RepID=A0A239CQG2_9BURK|nr:CNP1-like family protein [Noviherbaspirillum humi]SNS22347.1 CNP1-like family protein [Noviherbaspirillum humi]